MPTWDDPNVAWDDPDVAWDAGGGDDPGMGALIAMLQRVDPRPNKPPQLGLLASANLVVTDDDTEQAVEGPVRWIGGFAYRPEKCGGGAIKTVDANFGTPDTFGSEIDVVPYEVVGSDSVSTFDGVFALEESRDRARRDLLACEQKVIERELWTGALSVANGFGNRYLADSHVDLVESDRLLGYVTAFAALEQAINASTCGGQGMIHARADTVAFWAYAQLVHRVGNLLVSAQGTIVVAGAGYDGRAPAAGALHLDPAHAGRVPSTDSAWAYATTIIDVRRGQIFSPQSTQQQVIGTATDAAETNLVVTHVSRYAAATWGCLQAGVHVDHTAATSITGS